MNDYRIEDSLISKHDNVMVLYSVQSRKFNINKEDFNFKTIEFSRLDEEIYKQQQEQDQD